jgi:hypothetical protein
MISGTLPAATNIVIAAGAYWLKDITFTDTSGAANAITIYDTNRIDGGSSPRGPNKPAYTGATEATGSVTTSYTDQLGNSQSFTNTVITRTEGVSVGASTNPAAKTFITLSVPANGIVTYTPEGAVGFTYGIMIRTTGTCTYAANAGTLP